MIEFNREYLLSGTELIGRGSKTVICIKCQKQGSIVLKTTKSKGHSYEYYYVEHHMGKKPPKWCYMGKYENLPEDYKKLVKPPSPSISGS